MKIYIIASAATIMTASEAWACEFGTPSYYDDAPANSSTLCAVTLGGHNSDGATTTDHDWFRLQMEKGKSYRIQARIGNNNYVDPNLAIRDTSGNLLVQNDNASPYTPNSIIGPFVAPYTGIYFADISPKAGGSSARYYIAFAISAPQAQCKAGSLPGFIRGAKLSGQISRGNL